MLKNMGDKEVAHSQDAEVTDSMQIDSLKITCFLFLFLWLYA